MIFTYDETKRLANIARHGLDFTDCDVIFDGPIHSWEDSREAYGEQRFCTLGFLNGILVHLTYTERGGDMHVISLRKAEKYEIKLFAQRFSR
jgi:uncharacterized DUF497 family protein